MRTLRSGVGAALAMALAGCAALSENGPTSDAILSQRSTSLPYALVPITPAVVAALDATEPDRLAGRFPPNRRPSKITLQVGDVVSIAVYEAAVGGLFIPGDSGARPGNYVSVPTQPLDNQGNISFPFGGLIHAAGLTTAQLQGAIVRRIRDRAIDPQVVVSVVSQQANQISVEGDVRQPLRYPAAMSGAADRVSDAIARAGGLSDEGDASWVTLTRDGRSATVPFEALLLDRSQDIYVQPGDRILVYREPQTFVALGALGPRARSATALLDGGSALIPFETWRLSLAQAVAKAGGLLDARADPGAVFLYRREPAVVAARLGVASIGPLDIVPVVFQLDLRDPAGFLLATRFPMRNGDLLYVANARSAEISKAAAYFGTFVAAATSSSAAVLASNAALRGAGSPGLPAINGLTVVPSGISGLPGTVSTTGIGNGVAPTSTPTGGTQQAAGTAPTGQTGGSAPAVSTTSATNAALQQLLKPRGTSTPAD